MRFRIGALLLLLSIWLENTTAIKDLEICKLCHESLTSPRSPLSSSKALCSPAPPLSCGVNRYAESEVSRMTSTCVVDLNRAMAATAGLPAVHYMQLASRHHVYKDAG